MSNVLTLPILRELVPGGLSYGTMWLVEFDPRSIWYEASYTIAAQALRAGIRTEYHTYMHMPSEVRTALTQLGLDVKKLEEEDVLEMMDSYTIQTGLAVQEKSKTFRSRSLKVSDWSIGVAQEIKSPSERRRRSLHICDNNSVLHRYNKENEIVDLFRTRIVPLSRVNELAIVEAFTVGVHSEAFYKELESLHDVLIDFKSEERSGQIEHYARVKHVRGKAVDSRWLKLKILDNGEVALAT